MNEARSMPGKLDYCPYYYYTQKYLDEPDPKHRKNQEDHQKSLSKEIHFECGPDCFVSPFAHLGSKVIMGKNSWIAAGAIVRGDIQIGDYTTVNSYTRIDGKVKIGTGVRIASHTSIYGANHGHADPHRPIYLQGLTTQGIEVGDDVWIGAHVVIVDGVKIGSHSILAAGTIVTKDVPEYSIVAGNPGRVIRNRLTGAKSVGKNIDVLHEKLSKFGAKVKAQLPDLLKSYHVKTDEGAWYQDDDQRPSIAAMTYAVEIASVFGGKPDVLPAEEIVSRLQKFQDSKTGFCPDPWNGPSISNDYPENFRDTRALHHVLSVGYALELLNAKPLHPIRAFEEIPVEKLSVILDQLPWAEKAWWAGGFIDSLVTGFYFNKKYFSGGKGLEALFGWLQLHVNRITGMWGEPVNGKWLMPVNGFYRLTRGTYAQFGVSVPYPKQAIDTILEHSRDTDFFRDDRGTACHVLDIVHPYWLCAQGMDYRKEEMVVWCHKQIDRILGKWVDGKGFSFELEHGDTPRRMPSLCGTEMWLSILFTAAEICSKSDALGYRPRGIHRLEPATFQK